MQTFSWDEEISLSDGILFDIDFEQDFSASVINLIPLSEMDTDSIVEFITKSDGDELGTVDVSKRPRLTLEQDLRKRALSAGIKRIIATECAGEKRKKKDKRMLLYIADDLDVQIDSMLTGGKP